MKCGAGRFVAVPLSVSLLLAILAACAQVGPRDGRSPSALKYDRDMYECAALEVRHPVVWSPYGATDPSMKADGAAPASCVVGDFGVTCPVPDGSGGGLREGPAADSPGTKAMSFRKACMSSRGWQQLYPEDVQKAQAAPEWQWGSGLSGAFCKNHSECGENLYCRESVCASFTTAPWGGMGPDGSCLVYYDCHINLLCRKEICMRPPRAGF
jgi:hypothetical protein